MSTPRSKVGTAIVMTDVTEEKDKLQEQIENERISSTWTWQQVLYMSLGNPLNSILYSPSISSSEPEYR